MGSSQRDNAIRRISPKEEAEDERGRPGQHPSWGCEEDGCKRGRQGCSEAQEEEEDDDKKGKKGKKKKRRNVEIEYDPDHDVMLVKRKRKGDEGWEGDWE